MNSIDYTNQISSKLKSAASSSSINELEQLANDNDTLVRRSIAWNKNCTLELYQASYSLNYILTEILHVKL